MSEEILDVEINSVGDLDINTMDTVMAENYDDLSGKPRINGVTLTGNKTTSELGISVPTKTSDLTNDSNFIVKPNTPASNSVIGLDKNGNINTLTVQNNGFIIDNNVFRLTNAVNMIEAKKSVYDKVGCADIDKAVKVGVTTNTISLSDTEKLNAQSWLGVDTQLATKQNTLTAGDNITIENNVISATGGGTTYSAGENIQINNNVISATDTKDYNALTNKPTIPSKTSDLTNDSGFLTSHQDISGKQDKLTAGSNITIIDNVISASGGSGGTSDYSFLTNKPKINSIELLGNKTTSDLQISYNDLLNTPTIPSKTSDLTNDSGFLTAHQDITGKQDKLTAGSNITISGSTISATDTTYSAGSGISISNNVISATGGGSGGSDIATDTLNNKLESYILRGEVVDLTSLNTLLENKINGVT